MNVCPSLPNQDDFDVVFQMKGTFAVATLGVVEEEERLSPVVETDARTEGFVVGEVHLLVNCLL